MPNLHDRKFKARYETLAKSERQLIEAAWEGMHQSRFAVGWAFGGQKILSSSAVSAESIAEAEKEFLQLASAHSAAPGQIAVAHRVPYWPSTEFLESLIKIAPEADFLFVDNGPRANPAAGTVTRWTVKELLDRQGATGARGEAPDPNTIE